MKVGKSQHVHRQSQPALPKAAAKPTLQTPLAPRAGCVRPSIMAALATPTTSFKNALKKAQAQMQARMCEASFPLASAERPVDLDLRRQSFVLERQSAFTWELYAGKNDNWYIVQTSNATGEKRYAKL